MNTVLKFVLPTLVGLSLVSAPAFAQRSSQGHDRDRQGYEQRRDDRRSQYSRSGNQRNQGRRQANPRYVQRQQPVHRAPPRVVYRAPPTYRYQKVYGPAYGWSRGQRIHQGPRPVQVVHHYHDYGLYQPGRGHHWVRDDVGNFLLVAAATGVIVELLRGY